MSNNKTGYPNIDKPWEKQYVGDKYKNIDELKTVYQWLSDNNKDFDNNLAIEYFGSKIDFGKMFKNIDATAKSLKEYGIKKGDFITVCVAGIPEMVYTFYAASKIGAVCNMIAPHFDKQQLAMRIEDCESDLLIVMDSFYDEIKDSIKNSRIKNVVVLPTLNSSKLKYVSKKYKLEKHSNEIYFNDFMKDGKYRCDTEVNNYSKNLPLAMVYSSGTTGASKGILLPDESFTNLTSSYLDVGVNISRGQKFYQIIPPWFSTGISVCINLPLFYGSSVFMDPRFEKDIFVKNIFKAKPNYAVAPTSMYEGFLDPNLPNKRDLSFFCYPYEGGEPLRKEVKEKVDEVFRNYNSDATLKVAYGQCEGGASIATQTLTACRPGSVGIPVPGINLAISDSDRNFLPYNTRGEILANTPLSMIEYYKNKTATDEYFYYDKEGNRWNCTGDIGYIDESGELFVLGRASDFTVINDKKIYNFDVEDIVLSFDEVKMCDVLEKKIDDKELLTLHIVLSDKTKNKINNGQESINDLLLDIQKGIYDETGDVDMVPYTFKIRNDFPYAKSGKRDMEKLRSEDDGFIFLDKYTPNTKVRRLIC